MEVLKRFDPYSQENSKETVRIMIESLVVRQAAKAVVDPYKAEAPVIISDEDLPFRTVHVGDIHLAHDDADPYGLINAVVESGHDLMVTHSNLIDSINPKHLNTNTTRVGQDLNEQENVTKAILADKITNNELIALGENMCHEGAPAKNSSHDPVRQLVGPTTPLLYSGGQVVFQQDGDRIGSVEVYHNGGKGRTKQSPEGSMRARSREMPVGHPDRPDALVDAHMHQLVAAQDVIHNPNTDTDIVTTLAQVGADKGSKNRPDRFLVGIGVPPRFQPADAGHGLSIVWNKNKQTKKLAPYPVAGYERGRIIYQAEKLWNRAVQTGADRDIEGLIKESGKFTEPTKEINEGELIIAEKDRASKVNGTSPIYETLSYNLNANLPIRIHDISGLRVGASSFKRQEVMDLLRNIDNDQWAYFIARRRLIDKAVNNSPDREGILQDMASVLNTAKSSLLAIMLTDELVKNGWSKDVKINKEVVSEALLPGDWLYNESVLKGVPLIATTTMLNLNIKSGLNNETLPYVLGVRDKLSYLTSFINPFHGLTQIQALWGIEADVHIGGHTEIGGWRTWMRPWGQLEIVVPGGFSDFIEKGPGNKVKMPLGGQGSIFFPNRKLLYSFATAADGIDKHKALWMQEGLHQLGVLDSMRKKILVNK